METSTDTNATSGPAETVTPPAGGPAKPAQPGSAPVPPGVRDEDYERWLASLPTAPSPAHQGTAEGSAVRTPHSPHTQPHGSDQGKKMAGGPHTALFEPSSAPAARLPEWLPAPVRTRLTGLEVDRLPEVLTGRAPSLGDQVQYATKGAWTATETGPRRTAHKLYTCVIAIPVIVACRLISWAVERPARLGFLCVFLTIVGTALGYVPVIGFVVPDALNVMAWF